MLSFSVQDIVYIRVWDFTTPIFEVMRTLNDIVSMGKVHYLGVCDTPAYIVSACNTLAQNKGWA
jgi:aryl-alcohol dehydrogenase-like predicted oxidoreductase